MYPNMIVPTIPTIVPALANAAGMARIPEPRDDFRRFANDLTSLEINVIITKISAYYCLTAGKTPHLIKIRHEQLSINHHDCLCSRRIGDLKLMLILSPGFH